MGYAGRMAGVMREIVEVRGREILDSRGNPTVEAEVRLAGGAVGMAAAPSGASTGCREAVELRDEEGRFAGRGVRRAVANVEEALGRAVMGVDARLQAEVDARLVEVDGSADKGRLGANAMLAVSLAVLKAAAVADGVPLYAAVAALMGQEGAGEDGWVLPVPLMNILNGGAHADNTVDVQEFMVVPHGFAEFAEALRAGCEVFYALRAELQAAGLSCGVGDEGGFAPNVDGTAAALELVGRAIVRAGYAPGTEVSVALDVAASELWVDGVYALPGEGFRGDAAALTALVDEWAAGHPIVSVEDGCGESDWEGWREMSRRLGGRLQLVGDDVFVTNPALVREGVAAGVGNAVLVKPNQIGTVSETLEAVRVAHAAGYRTVMSHRSGETEYADIADLAVGCGCGQIKTGAPCRGERTAKYNRLLRIAEEGGRRAVFGGTAVFGRGGGGGGRGAA